MAAPTIICFYFGNIEATPWMVVFMSDGSITGVNTNTSAAIVIAPAGTILNPSIDSIGVSQWGSAYILIVANQPNGYWQWNGTVLTTAGTTYPYVTVTNGGSGYSPTPTVTVSGGSGSGVVLQATVQGGIITTIAVLNPGSGYLTGESVTVNISDPTGTSAAASMSLMPFGVQGTAIEVYTSHVWIAQPSTPSVPASITFSAPGDPGNFATSAGGGNFPLTDSFTRVNCVRLLQNNGFLWLICDSSISYISNVVTSGSGPITTTFTNQNANPEVGTPWPTAVEVWGQYLVLANPFGVHVSTGGAIDKISEMLDGIYNTVPGFAGFSPSSAKAIIFGKKTWMALVPVIDQVSGQQVNKLLMWAGKGWFTSQQDKNLIYIASQEINSVQTAYGTDGADIFPLFAQPSINFTKTVQSKLFAEPSGYLNTKTTSRLWGLAQYYSPLAPDLTISIDNEIGVAPQTVTVGGLTVVWHTMSGAVMNWTIGSGAPMVWSISGTGIAVFPPTAVAQNGALLGLTVSTNAADMALLSLMLGPVTSAYRG